MRLQHPIFHSPLEAQVELTEVETPSNYASWPEGAALPAKLPAWRVQNGEVGKEVDYGLVSSPYGFEDTPDAEWISSGVNSKGPTAMALGRQANWFLWGFAGDPTQMTESGRRVFLNTIVYMKQFDGQTPLLKPEGNRDFTIRARDWALVYAGFVKELGADAGAQEFLRSRFPAHLVADGIDAGRIEAYYRENFEMLYPGENGLLDVDADLKALGVSNRKPEFLDRMAARMQEMGASDPLVMTLADRYLPEEAPRDPARFAAWLAQNRDRLFFSDVYGYRWFVGPRAAAAAGTR
ncbi:MAG: hypothetical protein EYC70_10525 [Planctomycetota bacterium]|nr:MAG: hypothetical protein EYC70_10525 [Planctomycetota bacterium]